MNHDRRRRPGVGWTFVLAALAATLVAVPSATPVAAPSAALAAGTASGADDGTAYEELTIHNPDRTLTIRDLRAAAEGVSAEPLPAENEVLVVAADSRDVTWAEIDRLQAGQDVPGLRLIYSAGNAAPHTTVGDLAGTPTVAMMKWKYKKTRFKTVITCQGHDCPAPPAP